MHKYIFLDRDGTLIQNKHYLSDPEQVEFCEGAFEGLAMLSKLGYRFVVVTNQSGIGRGYFEEEAMHAVHSIIQELLNAEGIQIEEFLFCPHRPEENCVCRKPRVGMITEFCSRVNVDLDRSWMIGDRLCDIMVAHHLGVKGGLVESFCVDLAEYVEAMKRSTISGKTLGALAGSIALNF